VSADIYVCATPTEAARLEKDMIISLAPKYNIKLPSEWEVRHVRIVVHNGSGVLTSVVG